MKKYIFYLVTACLTFLSSVTLTSCGDDDTVDANDVLTVKSVLPTKVMEGQVVTITGLGLEKATSVVFPGNVAVKDIDKVGNGYISVVTPAGVSLEGGAITVEADGESATSVMTVSVGKPEPLRVAPLDKEIKINECVEVYGSDLEFITKAYFPGENGESIEVDATEFKRKATSSLFIYSPKGIKAGPAQVVLEDCSGKKYTLPEVTLSDQVSGGSSAGDGFSSVWEGDVYIYDWSNWQYLATDQFNFDGITLSEGMTMRLTFDNPSGASVCVCDGNWGQPNVTGDGGNTKWVEAGTSVLEFPISQGMVDTFNSGTGIIIGGGNFTLKKIEIKAE